MTERELQALIRETCRRFGLLGYHTHDSRRSDPGWPDLVLVGGRGCLFRELKTQRGKLRPEQVTWIAALDSAGLDVDVWRPSDWPARIVAELGAIR